MRDGLSWVNLQGALMAGGWKAGGQLCCLLGLSPCWAVIKSRSWCEAFLAGQQWASVPGELGCVPEKTCYRVPVICFSDFIVILIPSQDFFFFFPTMGQIHHSQIPAQNLKLLLLMCQISNTRSGWILMLFSDIFTKPLDFKNKRHSVKVTRITKKANFKSVINILWL